MSTKTAAALLFASGLTIFGSALLPRAVAAQESPPDPLNAGTAAQGSTQPTVVTPAAPTSTSSTVVPRVVAATSNDENPNRIALGYVVSVRVAQLKEYLESSGA